MDRLDRQDVPDVDVKHISSSFLLMAFTLFAHLSSGTARLNYFFSIFSSAVQLYKKVAPI